MIQDLPLVLDFFKEHYITRLGAGGFKRMNLPQIKEAYCLESPALKPDNGPRLLLHQDPVQDVIVLAHGLSDSPFYMQAVACCFYAAGCHVVMPLLPAHGLVEPDLAMKDEFLDQKWQETIDHSVQTAAMLGNRISIGGFSAGGTLSLNRILRDPSGINGGLFLFSGALSLGGIAEVAGRLRFIQSITRITAGKIVGAGRDPYKYPMLPSFAGFELVQIINENKALIEGKKVGLPVLAAHSLHDTTVELAGILQFMEKEVEKGVSILIAAGVPHASLPLDKEIPLDLKEALGPEIPPPANPMFAWMMEGAIRFFEREVKAGIEVRTLRRLDNGTFGS